MSGRHRPRDAGRTSASPRPSQAGATRDEHNRHPTQRRSLLRARPSAARAPRFHLAQAEARRAHRPDAAGPADTDHAPGRRRDRGPGTAREAPDTPDPTPLDAAAMLGGAIVDAPRPAFAARPLARQRGAERRSCAYLRGKGIDLALSSDGAHVIPRSLGGRMFDPDGALVERCGPRPWPPTCRALRSGASPASTRRAPMIWPCPCWSAVRRAAPRISRAVHHDPVPPILICPCGWLTCSRPIKWCPSWSRRRDARARGRARC